MKFDMKTIGRYVVLGAAAIAAPAFLGDMVMGLADFMSMSLGHDAFTLGGVLLSSAGIFIVDQLVFKK